MITSFLLVILLYIKDIAIVIHIKYNNISLGHQVLGPKQMGI